MLAAVLLLAAANAQIDFYVRLEKFDKHYQLFMNELCHWPQSEKCDPGLGSINYREFKEARRAAIKLFDLQERKQGIEH